MVMGDSHVRRLAEHQHILAKKLKHVKFYFYHQGGAHLDFVENNLHRAEGFDILVVMAGGNELLEASKQYYMAAHDRILTACRELGIRVTIFPSIWPRGDRQFNIKAKQLAEFMAESFQDHPRAVHWMWDRRLPMKNYDGTH
jgi:hypothetical protein